MTHPLPPFAYRHDVLHVEDVDLACIARDFGTPAYVYSRAAIETAFAGFTAACGARDVLVCYALKANSNLAIIDLLARAGAGFDIVSGGELKRVLAAGGDPGRIVFSGVGKSRDEIGLALKAGIRCFNVESESELMRIDRIAASLGVRAPVSLRVNPDVDAETHPYISTGLRDNKFGIAHEDAIAAYRLAARLPNVEVLGIDCHIGSQITTVEPWLAAADKILELVDRLQAEGIILRHIDFGGGLGIQYRDETPPTPAALLGALFERLDRHQPPARHALLFEFGRSIVGNAGVLLTRVEYLKRNGEHHFAIVDAAMNDLMRPALYGAWHEILPVERSGDQRVARRYDIVGPVCETGDWLARDRMLALAEDDVLAIASAGAYGMAMASNYNTRTRPVEILVDGAKAHVIRERETPEALFALERRLP